MAKSAGEVPRGMVRCQRRLMDDRRWFFYIVRCRDGSVYCGVTPDIEARLKAHNAGTGAKYTSSRRPVMLVYWEAYDNASEARKREAQVKAWSSMKREYLIAGTIKKQADPEDIR
jgi:putative endonuclease